MAVREAFAVAAIEKLGGKVVSVTEERRPQTWLEKQFDDPGDADDPVRVKTAIVVGLPTNATDAGLEHIKMLTNLSALHLGYTNVTDDGLEHLTDLKNLQHLDLSGTRVTGTGLKHLKRLTELQTLRLENAAITDAGLEHLKGLSSLKELDLFGTQVTDAGLEHLTGLKSLEKLKLGYFTLSPELAPPELRRTNVTSDGVKRLRQALPKCIIGEPRPMMTRWPQ
jgi:hypothetical protein